MIGIDYPQKVSSLIDKKTGMVIGEVIQLNDNPSKLFRDYLLFGKHTETNPEDFKVVFYDEPKTIEEVEKEDDLRSQKLFEKILKEEDK